MNSDYNKVKNKLSSISTSISSVLIIFLQYVPCTGIWFGIMSVPLVAYISLFFSNPNILLVDIQFLMQSYGFYIVIFGFILFIYTVVYQLTHRKQLMRTGPYRYIRHPQYLAFIIMTLGMTLVAFQTSPIFEFPLYNVDGHTILFLIWIGEVLAYIFLGKIEELALKAKYGDEFLEYANDISFMIPFFKINRINLNKKEVGI